MFTVRLFCCDRWPALTCVGSARRLCVGSVCDGAAAVLKSPSSWKEGCNLVSGPYLVHSHARTHGRQRTSPNNGWARPSIVFGVLPILTRQFTLK